MGTRPPTVVLTADNIARLRSFPRPANDNGRGLHFSIDLRDDSIAWTVDNLRSIDARWTLIYAQDELQAGRAARACWNAGIMPVVRIGKKINESVRQRALGAGAQGDRRAAVRSDLQRAQRRPRVAKPCPR